jgi:Tol biopolymer transport system component
VNTIWSADGTKLTYFTGGPVDSIFVAAADGSGAQRVFWTKAGEHSHYPVWSPDGRYVYFVRGGVRLTQADVWRVPAAGGDAEQITHHRSDVRYPALIDDRTLVYIAPAAEGSGSALYGMDVERRVPHRLNIGVEQYRSVAASPGGAGGRRRLVAAVANPSSHVWTVPVGAGMAGEKDARQVALPSVRAGTPRAGPGFLLYLSSTGGDAGIWKFKDSVAVELWKPGDGASVATPVISRDGQQLSFVARKAGRGTLFLMTADGTGRRALAEQLDVQDEPSWSPDGQWLVVAANDGKGTKLFKVQASDGAAVVLRQAAAHYPQWSPDGRFVLFRETDKQQIEAITPEGKPYEIKLPPLVFRNAVGNPYRFFPDNRHLAVMLGQYRQENLWMADFQSGEMRQLTDLTAGFSITSFDVAPDGRSIVFDRVRQNADIVLIEPKQ